MGMLRRLLGNTDYPDSDAESNADSENVESICFLCQERSYLNSHVYKKHLETKHMVIFGLKEIRESVEEDEKQKQIPQMQPDSAVKQYNMNPMVFKIFVMHSKPHVVH